MKTLAEDLRDEEERLRRGFIWKTRKRGPLTMAEASELCKQIQGISAGPVVTPTVVVGMDNEPMVKP